MLSLLSVLVGRKGRLSMACHRDCPWLAAANNAADTNLMLRGYVQGIGGVWRSMKLFYIHFIAGHYGIGKPQK